MGQTQQAAWVFAGDSPGAWWVVHSREPRFAARLLSAEEFAAHPRLAAWVPHGINVAVPVHFNLGADVLVVTEFLDPITLDESASPPSAILTDAMIEALHACQRAISQVAAGNPGFAHLADRAEQFMVGWSLHHGDDGHWQARHASGACIGISFDAQGDCDASLQRLPRQEHRVGWSESLLRERLERVAGERALCIDEGWRRLLADDRSELQADVFSVLASQDRRRLSWVPCQRHLPGHEAAVSFAALRLSGPVSMVFPTAVEIDARSPLHLGSRPLTVDDTDAISLLRDRYGLSNAVGLVASRQFGWFEETDDDRGERRRTAPLPRYPCEVELLHGGHVYAAIVFEPPDARGLLRLVVAPHALAGNGPTDPAALLPFEGLVCRREQFHVPRYLFEPD